MPSFPASILDSVWLQTRSLTRGGQFLDLFAGQLAPAQPPVVDRRKVVVIRPRSLEAQRAGTFPDVQFAHLIPAHRLHAVLLELFTDVGYGTKIRSGLDWAASSGFPERGYWCWPRDGSEEAYASGADG